MPKNGPKLLLIDANNMAHRVFWTHKYLHFKGNFTGVLFGFVKQLIYLRKQFPGHFMVIAWDGGYARRKAESKAAVEAGIIPSSYKETREKAKEKADPNKQEEIEALYLQMDQLREEVLPLINCLQVKVDGVEGDDILYTYCDYVHKWNGEAVVVSSDKDFYQTLGYGDKIKVYDAMKNEVRTAKRFGLEWNFPATAFVDWGALVGESGPSSDNIFGAKGWGPKTASKYIQEYGSLEAIISGLKAKTKRSKKEQKLLDTIPRVMLARSLKQMDIIKGVPRPHCEPKDYQTIYAKWLSLGFMSLLKDIRLFT